MPDSTPMTHDELTPWTFDADDNTIACDGAPIFTVMREWDFPCIEDEDRPAADMEYLAHAQVAVMLLNMVATAKEETTGEALRVTIEQMREEIAGLREALEPFIAAAKIGVATYEAVKAANLRKQGLSIYDTIYISAGVHAAESRVSYADWEKVAALPPIAETKE